MAMQPARICFPFTGDVVGGSHISVLGLVRRLDPDRFQPLVVPQRADGAIAALFHAHGVPTETPLHWAELGYDQPIGPRHIARVLRDTVPQARFLRARGVDIVHTNDGRTHATWALPARLAGARLLWHQRGDPRSAGLRFLAPLLADRVVAVSRFALPAPGLWSAARKASVVHSPFATDGTEDREAARRALLAELGCAPGTAFIGYFGAFIGRKRPMLFIDAIADLARRTLSRPVMGLMFGEAYDGGQTEARLVARARADGIGEAVRLMGYRTPGTRWLAACDMLMVPATGEPFGRTLIEAMLVGTPVVATASGGNPEALRDGRLGLLVPPEDAGALADACVGLIERPGRAARIAAEARADARVRFGEAMHAARIAEIYEGLLCKRRRVRPAVSLANARPARDKGMSL
jgi:glycosyltransferase involved in cell wall biosynthesis